MGIDAQGCLNAASGLASAAVSRVREVSAQVLDQQPPEAIGQAAGLADELLTTTRENGELLLATIRSEVEKAVCRLGLSPASSSDSADSSIETRVQRLEAEVRQLRAGVPAQPVADQELQSTTGLGLGFAADPVSEDTPNPPAKKRKIYLEDPDG